ncbi:hypothetical protein Ae356Ps1_3252c [Pseudonocardia sp. Ae356_Ps1]|nr:hypothetical protein Ae356Ps1_3252c [Pseudonocardia sp. Ae356_Ps1]
MRGAIPCEPSGPGPRRGLRGERGGEGSTGAGQGAEGLRGGLAGRWSAGPGRRFCGIASSGSDLSAGTCLVCGSTGPCPVPRAPCPVPRAPCPVPRAPCPVPRGRWPVAGGRWPVAGGRWPVAGGRWPVAGGRWPVAVARGSVAVAVAVAGGSVAPWLQGCRWVGSRSCGDPVRPRTGRPARIADTGPCTPRSGPGRRAPRSGTPSHGFASLARGPIACEEPDRVRGTRLRARDAISCGPGTDPTGMRDTPAEPGRCR